MSQLNRDRGWRAGTRLTILILVCLVSLGGIASPNKPDAYTVAALGRVEGAAEAVTLSFTISGRVKAVYGKEGDRVRRGQVLAELECGAEIAEAESRRAALHALQNAFVRAKRGARPEERAVASARIASAAAELADAEAEFKQVHALLASNVASRRDVEKAQRRLDVAKAGKAEAEKQGQLTNSSLLPEELGRWEADVQAAKWALNLTVDRRDQCALKAPFDGILLRRPMLVGAVTQAINPQAAAVVLDDSRVNVRAEVDERDALLVKVGSKATVTAGHDPRTIYSGQVVWISPLMGRKRVRGTDPAEKSDRDVREILVELTKVDVNLPYGLRVTTAIAAKAQ